MKLIKVLMLTTLFFTFISMKAQKEIITTTTQLGGGKLEFSYYMDGNVKIPHGMMKFDNTDGKTGSGKYIEKGQMVDGYQEGEWIVEQPLSKALYQKVYNYKKGLLDGDVISREYKVNPQTKKKTLISEEIHHFKNGHLYGENILIHNNDTIYCNFDEKGRKIGTWKRLSPYGDKIIIAEYFPEAPEKSTCFTQDILGNKTEYDLNDFEWKLALALSYFDNSITFIPVSYPLSNRIVLPVKNTTKFGLYSTGKPIPEEE